MELNRLRVGSRDSALAVAQAKLVMERISRLCPGIELELVTMKTMGDKRLDRDIDALGGKGAFVRELDTALVEGRVDLCVHSLKDLPLDPPQGVEITTALEREDPRDALILPEGRNEPDSLLPLGCSSKRRTLQLKQLMPGYQTASIRGNVPTRLAKLDRGEYSGLILAAAGLRRLGLERRVSRYFSTEELIPACGQGILALTLRQGNTFPFLAGLEDKATADAARCELAFLRVLGGGCTSPVAAWARVEGDAVTITGYTLNGDGSMNRGSCSGSRSQAGAVGTHLARQLRGEAVELER